MDEVIKEFFKYLGVFIASVLTVWLKQLIDDRKKRQEERKKKRGSEAMFTLEFDLRVKIAEHVIMRNYGGCRMFVYNFSNGEFTESGLPFVKISMWHEVVEGHYVPYMAEHYQPPRICPEMFYAMFRDVFEHGFHYLESKDDIKVENPPLYEFMTTWDICSMLLVALTDGFGKPHAILVVHWPRKKYRNDEEILKMQRDIYPVEKIYREIKNSA